MLGQYVSNICKHTGLHVTIAMHRLNTIAAGMQSSHTKAAKTKKQATISATQKAAIKQTANDKSSMGIRMHNTVPLALPHLFPRFYTPCLPGKSNAS